MLSLTVRLRLGYIPVAGRSEEPHEYELWHRCEATLTAQISSVTCRSDQIHSIFGFLSRGALPGRFILPRKFFCADIFAGRRQFFCSFVSLSRADYLRWSAALIILCGL